MDHKAMTKTHNINNPFDPGGVQNPEDEDSDRSLKIGSAC